jgi:hypothetical protein
MIDMNKTYRTVAGQDVRILCVDCSGEFPVIGLITRCSHPRHEVVHGWDSHGNQGSHPNYNLVEVTPWDDFEIDELVMVRNGNGPWLRRYFAGVDEGRASSWEWGRTRWTAYGGRVTWDECRRPTPVELPP